MISARAQRAPHVSLPPREEEGASAETFRVSAAKKCANLLKIANRSTKSS
jgi:hypothetical protein